MGKKISLIFFAIIFTFNCFANTYYVSDSLGNDNYPGTFEQPIKTFSKLATLLSNGDYVYLNGEDTWLETLTLLNLDDVTIGSYGNGNAKLTGLKDITSFDRYGETNIYSAEVVSETSLYYWIKLVYENEVRLSYIDWNTDIATTSQYMIPGTWTLDLDNQIIYVYSLNSSEPENTKYSSLRNIIRSENCDNLKLSDMIVSGTNSTAIILGKGYSSLSENVYNCEIDNVSISNTGGRGLTVYGDNNHISFVNVSNFNPQDRSYIDLSGIMIAGKNNITEYNYSHDSYWGSAFECNGVITAQDFTTNNIFRYNISKNITNQAFEFWYASGNVFYGNYDRNIKKCSFKFTNGSSNNIGYNNISVMLENDSFAANKFADIYIGYTEDTAFSHDNYFYNNTFINKGTRSDYGSISIRSNEYENNKFENNLIFMKSMPCLYIKDDSTILNNNLYFTEASTAFVYMANLYSPLEFESYKTESEQDSQSVWGHPLCDDLGFLGKNSPAINAGKYVELTFDFNLFLRKGIIDIGACEFQGSFLLGGYLNGGNLS